MVNDKFFGDRKDLAVHEDAGVFAGWQAHGALGIEGVFTCADSPFVFAEVSAIVRVDDGEFALSEGYAAEGEAIAEASAQKHKIKYELVQPIRNLYGEMNFDSRPPYARS